MGRRSNGEGYYKKLPNGKWMAQIMDGFKENGKKNIKTFTAPTKGEAQQKVRDYLNRRDAGDLIAADMSFSDWADKWYADYKSQVQPSTHSGYQFTLKILKEHFGDQPLSEIKPVHINSFTIHTMVSVLTAFERLLRTLAFFLFKRRVREFRRS